MGSWLEWAGKDALNMGFGMHLIVTLLCVQNMKGDQSESTASCVESSIYINLKEWSPNLMASISFKHEKKNTPEYIDLLSKTWATL